MQHLEASIRTTQRALEDRLASTTAAFLRARRHEDPRDGPLLEHIALAASARLDGEPPHRVLAWAVQAVPRFAVTSSFGAEAAVLLHALGEVAPDVPVLFLDTGFHFPETLRYRRELADLLGLNVVDLRPALSPEEQARLLGENLFDRNPDECCRLRKVVPLHQALHGFDGWATGIRRDQTPQRAATPVVEAFQHDDRWLLKVAPLASWSEEEVREYQRRHGLPPHPLVGKGYLSIGCAPCTRPVSDGDGPRAGRWAAFAKTECGLHQAGAETIDLTPSYS